MSDGLTEPFSLRQVTSLRRLCLRFRSWTTSEILFTNGLLSSLPKQSTIEYIDICITEGATVSKRDEPAYVAGCNQMDTILNTPTFRSLQGFNIVCQSSDDTIWETVLKTAKARGILHIQGPFEPLSVCFLLFSAPL